MSTDHHQRVSDIADCRRNPDGISIDNAARNLMDDKPAYWSMPGGSSLGLSAQISSLANFHGSLKTAMMEKADSLAGRNIDIARDVYDKLIPLNMMAVEELDLLYRAQSTFRERFQLLNREETAITHPFSPAWPNQDSEAYAARCAEETSAAEARFWARRAQVVPTLLAAE